MSRKQAERMIENLGILIVDDNAYTRKLTRMMLMNIGAKSICEAADGVAALDVIRTANPDVAIMEWDLPVLTGSQGVKIVRSPEVFPKPHLPIIVLAHYAHRWRVQEALRLGVHEFLAKPTSPAALRDRLLSIMLRPRPMVKVGKLYVPEPRRLITPSEVVGELADGLANEPPSQPPGDLPGEMVLAA
jgi:CheY-like chemotaxis protein